MGAIFSNQVADPEPLELKLVYRAGDGASSGTEIIFSLK